MTTVITTTMTLTCMVSLQSFHGRFVSGASSPDSGATLAMVLGSVRFGPFRLFCGFWAAFWAAQSNLRRGQTARRWRTSCAARRSDAGRVQLSFTGTRRGPSTPQRRQMSRVASGLVRVGGGVSPVCLTSQHLTALYIYIFAGNGQLVQLNRTEDYGSSDGGLSPPLPSKFLFWIF